MSDRLFPLEEVPEVPLFREPRRRKGEGDARFVNDYPPEWNCCLDCDGTGKQWRTVGTFAEATKLGHAGIDVEGHGEGVGEWFRARDGDPCPACLGMGSVKARVRLEAGHRCERCRHPYMPKEDAAMLGVERSGMHDGLWTPWSACDTQCAHGGKVRVWRTMESTEPDEHTIGAGSSRDGGTLFLDAGEYLLGYQPFRLESEWRILTVHHLDGDKANLAWWNLAALCQRCHLEIQAKVVMERVYPHEHSDWFKPHAAGYYAWVYLGEQVSREEALERQDELLALERVA